MKHTLPLLSLSTPILIAFLTINPSLAFTKTDEYVLERNGSPLLIFHQYHIVPGTGLIGAGGGLTLNQTGNSTCPSTVLQLFSETNGEPLVFYKTKDYGPLPEGFYYKTGTPLDIEFAKVPQCAESSKWSVLFDDDILKPYVGVSNPNENRHTTKGTFNIQKYKKAYKLVFCVENVLLGNRCFNVVRVDNKEGGRRLVPSNDGEPYAVHFVRAAGGDAGIRSVV